jgi:DNA-binding MarR family transcriptional regulator
MSIQPLNDTLREWAEVFMRRSMHDFRDFTCDSGLSMSQFSALYQIYHNGACGVSDIGEHLGVTNAGASQMIDRLVQQGLLERTEDLHDRRSKHLALTSKGLALVHSSIEARRRWLAELTTALTPEQQEEISTALTLLIQAALNPDRSRPANTIS